MSDEGDYVCYLSKFSLEALQDLFTLQHSYGAVTMIIMAAKIYISELNNHQNISIILEFDWLPTNR